MQFVLFMGVFVFHNLETQCNPPRSVSALLSTFLVAFTKPGFVKAHTAVSMKLQCMKLSLSQGHLGVGWLLFQLSQPPRAVGWFVILVFVYLHKTHTALVYKHQTVPLVAHPIFRSLKNDQKNEITIGYRATLKTAL